jgi:uncharacterized membrane protein YjgN (DUF898 family)
MIPSSPPPEQATQPMPLAAPQPLRIQFTGSGSEYFRIWIVNLLLTIVTLSLYLPFAKARRLRYMHGNTLVDGHALGFHGEGKKMLRGYLLVLAFSGAYAAAGHFSPVAGLVALCVLAGLWPALWQTSLRFRLANTSWRGLRFRFTGSLGGAYSAMLISSLPALVFVAVSVATPMFGPQPPMWLPVLMGLSVLAMLGTVPLGLARIKRYQHGHYRFADETSELTASTGAFYKLWFKAGLISVLPIMVAGIAMAVILPAMTGPGKRLPTEGQVMAITGVVLLFYLAVFLAVQPYAVSRLQNLVWGTTRSPRLKFHSSLKFSSLAWLTLKNLLLMAVTLGLYRPFAVVATNRLRLEAITIEVQGDAARWSSAHLQAEADASGDAAGDLLGVDLGL